jgi:hypothetical protein
VQVGVDERGRDQQAAQLHPLVGGRGVGGVAQQAMLPSRTSMAVARGSAAE